MATLLDAFAWLLGRRDTAPVPGTGASAVNATLHEPLTTTTVPAIRALLDEHDRGVFLRSGLLAGLIRRDAAAFGALQQRLLSFQALPTVIEAADESPAAVESADLYRAERPRMIETGVQLDMALDECLSGFGIGQIVYRQRDDGFLSMAVESWPTTSVEYDRNCRRWMALTADGQKLPIRPGDGQWLLFAPSSAREPWLWGAIRPTAEWYLRNANAAADGSKRAEILGSSVWKAWTPTGSLTDAGKKFVNSLRNIGRNAVIPLARGAEKDMGYDVELIEAQSDAHKIFEWLMTAGGGAFRLAILGQDLTSQNNKVGTNASSETGLTVLDRITQAKARGWSTMETSQLAGPWSAYQGRPNPTVRVDADPGENLKAKADADVAASTALKQWQEAGVDVDPAQYAAAYKVPLRTEPSAPKRAQVFAYHLQYGLVSVNEARDLALGLPPRADGDRIPSPSNGTTDGKPPTEG